MNALETQRTMPFGRCPGCQDMLPLPPFGDGMCFLCATDGPPGAPTPAGGALGEDDVAPDPTAAWTEALTEDQLTILELFAEQRERWANAIQSDHYRSQRLMESPRSVDRPRPWRPITTAEAEAINARRARHREEAAQDSARAARREAKLAQQAVAEACIERRLLRPFENLHQRQVSIAARNGAGNYLPIELLERIIALRSSGLSLRAVQRETGVSKETIAKYTPWISRSEATKLMHARWAAEGRPKMLPPWARKRAAIEIPPDEGTADVLAFLRADHALREAS